MDVLGIAYDEFTNAQREGKAESVYFKSKAGAKVFRTGSIRWAPALSDWYLRGGISNWFVRCCSNSSAHLFVDLRHPRIA
jgi:hypothetical protein